MKDSQSRSQWPPAALEIFSLLGDKPVAYHANLTVRLSGYSDSLALHASLILSQSFFFDGEARRRGLEWWDKSDKAFSERLGFTLKQFRKARDLIIWEGLGLLDHDVRGMPATSYYHVPYQRIKAWLLANPVQPGLPLGPPVPIVKSLPQTGKLGYPKTGNLFAQSPLREERDEESVCGLRENLAPEPANQTTHPAITAFWEATGGTFWPQKALIKLIVDKVGDDPARIQLWRQINEARLLNGEFLMNVGKSFAYLDAGKIPEPAEVHPKQHKPRASSGRRPQVGEPTEAELEASRERARKFIEEHSKKKGM